LPQLFFILFLGEFQCRRLFAVHIVHASFHVG
jgi:hypothetical protein